MTESFLIIFLLTETDIFEVPPLRCVFFFSSRAAFVFIHPNFEVSGKHGKYQMYSTGCSARRNETFCLQQQHHNLTNTCTFSDFSPASMYHAFASFSSFLLWSSTTETSRRINLSETPQSMPPWLLLSKVKALFPLIPLHWAASLTFSCGWSPPG